MPQKRKAAKARTRTKARKPGPAGRVWMGTGLCPEAQGDGVPCRGVDGECETCGRALPRATAR
jgi:hypothetical protein